MSHDGRKGRSPTPATQCREHTMNTVKSRFYLAPAAALLLALAGCAPSGPGTGAATGASTGPMPSSMSMGSSSAAAPAMSEPASAPATIMIENFAYRGPASVAAGAMVTVTNKDSVAHTVTSDTGALFDAVVQPGASVSFKAPKVPGGYAFHCTFHANMHGSLVVK